MKRLLEIRSYRLKAGTLGAFARSMHEQALPLLRSQGMDVVACGRSDHEEESYFLMRSYASREALEREQAAFYGSDAWKAGPRSALVACIETYLNTLLWASPQALASLRELNAQPPGPAGEAANAESE